MAHRQNPQHAEIKGRWTKVVDWLGAQGPVNLSIYSCLIVSIGTVLAKMVQ